MHELGIVTYVAKSVTKIAAENNVKKNSRSYAGDWRGFWDCGGISGGLLELFQKKISRFNGSKVRI